MIGFRYTTMDGKEGFGITKFPDRKNHCLFLVNKDKSWSPIAYFKSEKEAMLLSKMIWSLSDKKRVSIEEDDGK